MQITITLNGVAVKKEIPQSWEQVKFREFLQISDAPKEKTARSSHILSALTGIDVETIKKAKITNLDDVLLALSFFDYDADLKVPNTCLGYKIPKDLGFETVAQYEDLKLHIKESEERKDTPIQTMANYPLYCALYTCAEKYGEYDWKKAEEMAPAFMDAPAMEVLAIGYFTFVKLIGLKNGIKSNAHKPVTRLKKLRLVLKAWVMSLVLPVRLHIWKRRHLTKKASL